MEYTTSEVFLPARPRSTLIPRVRLPDGGTEPVLADEAMAAALAGDGRFMSGRRWTGSGRHLRFHRYDRLPASSHVDDLLQEIDPRPHRDFLRLAVTLQRRGGHPAARIRGCMIRRMISTGRGPPSAGATD